MKKEERGKEEIEELKTEINKLLGTKDYIRWIISVVLIGLWFIFPDLNFWVLFCIILIFFNTEILTIYMRARRKRDENIEEIIEEIIELMYKKSEQETVPKKWVEEMVMRVTNQINQEKRKRGENK